MDSGTDVDLPEVDLTPFDKALQQLHIALRARDASPADALIRDAVIQRFEFTYELSVRMMRRYLVAVAISEEEVHQFTYRQLIGRAVEMGLLTGSGHVWLDFRQARTDTVHTYNEIRALEVAAIARDFGREAQQLFESLTRRLKT